MPKKYLTKDVYTATIERLDYIFNEFDNILVAFSGGKDSTVLHHLIDMALPNNKIPRVYMNTGIDYQYIYQFVNKLNAILSKKITYQKAFMLGKLKVKGNFSVLPKLDQVFKAL